jgi:hypothetical protein
MGGWDHAGLKREQMDDNDMEPILQVVKVGERPKWEAHPQGLLGSAELPGG